MEREEFIKSLGLGLALVCTGSCFQACTKSDDGAPTPLATPPGSTPTVSVDITTIASIGSQTTISGVLFFRIAAPNQTSSFVATEALCPHQGGTLTWQAGSSKIQCERHQATYSDSGAVLSNPVGGGTTRALKIYAVALTGTILTATKS